MKNKHRTLSLFFGALALAAPAVRSEDAPNPPPAQAETAKPAQDAPKPAEASPPKSDAQPPPGEPRAQRPGDQRDPRAHAGHHRPNPQEGEGRGDDGPRRGPPWRGDAMRDQGPQPQGASGIEGRFGPPSGRAMRYPGPDFGQQHGHGGQRGFGPPGPPNGPEGPGMREGQHSFPSASARPGPAFGRLGRPNGPQPYGNWGGPYRPDSRGPSLDGRRGPPPSGPGFRPQGPSDLGFQDRREQWGAPREPRGHPQGGPGFRHQPPANGPQQLGHFGAHKGAELWDPRHQQRPLVDRRDGPQDAPAAGPPGTRRFDAATQHHLGPWGPPNPDRDRGMTSFGPQVRNEDRFPRPGGPARYAGPRPHFQQNHGRDSGLGPSPDGAKRENHRPVPPAENEATPKAPDGRSSDGSERPRPPRNSEVPPPRPGRAFPQGV